VIYNNCTQSFVPGFSDSDLLLNTLAHALHEVRGFALEGAHTLLARVISPLQLLEFVVFLLQIVAQI
jgi:hypothetical protein